MNKKNSKKEYGDILKSTSIVGGAQAITYLIKLLRIKIVAILLGRSGVGLIGLYQSAMVTVSTVSGMGINSSGVREIAAANKEKDSQGEGFIVAVLTRSCLLTGLVGCLAMVVLATPLTEYLFDSNERRVAVACLGAALFLSALSGGRKAVLQGKRRIKDLAKLKIIGAAASTILALAIYSWAGEKGIVPLLILTSALDLAATWWFEKSIQLEKSRISWREWLRSSKRLFVVGSAFMWSGLLATLVALFTRSLIVKDLGLEANGVYQAAWALSGMFALFILQAMGADFFPRLTALADSPERMNDAVNQQTEIGVLLAVPGLVGTLCFASQIIQIFYTDEFIFAAGLMPFFVMGVFGQIVAWPMGLIQQAKGATNWMFLSQTNANILLMLLTYFLFKSYGLIGAAAAFALLYPVQTLITYLISRHLTGFSWSPAVVSLLLKSMVSLLVGLFLHYNFEGWMIWLLGMPLVAVTALYNMKGLATRLDDSHKLIRLCSKSPGLMTFLGKGK